MKKNLIKPTAVFVAVLLLVVASFGCSPSATPSEGTLLSNVSTEEIDNDDPAAPQAEEPAQDFSYVDVKEDLSKVTIKGQDYTKRDNVVNILLLGIDSDADRARQRMGWRSDMIMLVSIDKDAKTMTCISIPRDTRAIVYYLDENGNITKEAEEKLNHAYGYGHGPTKYSAENAVRCITKFLECDGQINVPIEYYVSMDMDGLPKLADAMGGVTVTLDQRVPDVGSKGDTVTLSGSKVRKFLETRHGQNEGEFSRQMHSQIFVNALFNQIKDMGASLSAPGLYNTFATIMRTNLTSDDVDELALVLDETAASDIQFKTMEQGEPQTISGTWYYIADQDEVLNMMLDALYQKI